jgi:hypothetical protein
MKHTVTASLIAVAIAGFSTAEMSATCSHTQHGRTKAFLAASYLQTARLARPLNDTVRKSSRIVSVSFDGQNDLLTVRLDLADSQSWMEISLYNMLGKRVKEIYRGPVRGTCTRRVTSQCIPSRVQKRSTVHCAISLWELRRRALHYARFCSKPHHCTFQCPSTALCAD